MTDDIEALFARYQRKGILIDTNILLLWLVGSTNKARITKFNRTQGFVAEDYELLVDIFQTFQKVLTTPNILTEVSNLINQLGEPERSQCFSIFARDIIQLDEIYTDSHTIAATDKFTKFGLTDCGIASLAKGNYLVLTEDFKLANYLQTIGIDTVNFNNIRMWK
jgi:rRNA-processing protein FCF1